MIRFLTGRWLWGLALSSGLWAVGGRAAPAAAVVPPSSLAALKLWFRHPATNWEQQALPLGNGRLGAMVFGGPEQERLQLNEHSLWSGGPRDANNPEAYAHLAEVRRLLFANQPAAALDLAERYLMGRPSRLQPYQSLGNLRLEFPGHEEATEYRRELDLDKGLVRITYRVGAAHYTREIFISHPDQVLVMRLTCDQPAGITLFATLDREQDFSVIAKRPTGLIMEGQIDQGKGLDYQVELAALADGGQVYTPISRLEVRGANAVTLILGAATSFGGREVEEASAADVARASKLPYPVLLANHIADHQRLFHRVELDLGGAAAAQTPTDERLARVRQGGVDPQLFALYFQYARYLLIASSRPGDLPANLQGLWADGMKPPWNADYHLNINLEMNYWPAEVANLPECAEPLFQLIESLREPGRRTAQVHYHAHGFVVHHITDVWGFTAPGDGPRSGLWPMGGAWLCQSLWEHYAFSGDRAFLAERAYPTMKEAAEFFLEYLVEDGHGHLVTGPSISPENNYRLPNGEVGALCMGPTMDTEIVHDLFTNCIEASEILHLDPAFRAKLQATLKRLLPLRVGKHGQLMEWAEDYDEPDPGHRHISQLFALHPGRQITLRGTPELAKAARVTLERRLAFGGGRTGWSRAWIVSFWARLGDGERAYENLVALLRHSTAPNLLDLHPPFQIDGNFGGAAGLGEMLLQSQADELDLLPACPKAWADGHVTGLRARGAFVVALNWHGGRLTEARLESLKGNRCRVRSDRPLTVYYANRRRAGPTVVRPAADVVEFATRPGTSYRLEPAP